LTETELVSRLSEMVDIVDIKKNPFAYSNPDQSKKYIGRIESRQFRIHRIVIGMNSFLPIIRGTIIDNFSERIIELKMRVHFINVVFLLLIAGIAFYSMIKNSDSDFSILIMFGLYLGMTIFFFNQECNRSIKDLEDVFID